VLLSPFRRLSAFDLWYHFISSSLSNWISLAFKQCFKSTSCGSNTVVSAFLSNCSILVIASYFSFLEVPLAFLAHPLKYFLRFLILFCHFPCLWHLCSLFAILVLPPHKTSLFKSQLSSNLNMFALFCFGGCSESSIKGEWSEISLVRA
jgi:hypothetical protein